MNAPPLGWLGIVRLGLVQTALGADRRADDLDHEPRDGVELALPAMLPGAAGRLHYAVQMLRPRLGLRLRRRRPAHALDRRRHGGAGARRRRRRARHRADARRTSPPASRSPSVAFVLIGIGVGAAGTSLLVLLAKRVAPERRAAAATIVWVMMIVGFTVTAGIAGHFLDPFSLQRLVVGHRRASCAVALV